MAVERRKNMYYYIRGIVKFSKYRGRATRREYWCYSIINAVIIALLLVLHAMFAVGAVHTVLTYLLLAYVLFQIMPTLCITSRRWHDIGRTGLWVWLNIVPVVGAIVTMFFFFARGDEGTNQYGRDPRERETRQRNAA